MQWGKVYLNIYKNSSAKVNFSKNTELFSGQTHVKTLSDKITESVKF